MAERDNSLSFFSSFSRTIPQEELQCAKVIASKATLESTNHRNLSLGAPASGNSKDQARTSSLGDSVSSRLRLKTQYIFNVYEEVDEATVVEFCLPFVNF